MSEIIDVDILICGGGSAGFGAAYQACLQSHGKFTIALVEKNEIIGGTSTVGGVNVWEMGIGGPGIHTELAQRLMDMDNQAAIIKGNWKPLTRRRPYALHAPSNDYNYEDTLQAAGVHDRVKNHNSFIFEPKAMANEMLKILVEVSGGNFSFYNNETILSVSSDDNNITEVITDKHVFSPKVVIDCTGDIIVARAAGCEFELGSKGMHINGVTQVYRVEKKAYASIDILPKQYQLPYHDAEFEKRLDNVQVISSINTYPNGDLNINPLPTMEGDKFFALSRSKAIEMCHGRVYLHWRRMQCDSPFMRNYRVKEIYPMIGIRESYRLKGRYVLTSDDVLVGIEKQNKSEEIVALSDHPIDVHGGDSPGIKILDKPYGIPFRCLLPMNLDNMIVACRGSSFDSTAAASCRLSRTMITLGEAAGCAANLSLTENCCIPEIDTQKLRRKLGISEFIDAILD